MRYVCSNGAKERRSREGAWIEIKIATPETTRYALSLP